MSWHYSLPTILPPALGSIDTDIVLMNDCFTIDDAEVSGDSHTPYFVLVHKHRFCRIEGEYGFILALGRVYQVFIKMQG
jgi:hypothetical protein